MCGRQSHRSARRLWPREFSSLDSFCKKTKTIAVPPQLKIDAGRELLLAVAAVLGGKQFLSSSLEGHQFTDRDILLQRLKAEGVDTDGALHEGTYISLDAADTLSTIMVNDLPDPVRFFERIGGFIEAAARAAQSDEPQVVVFGEAVDLLQAEGKAHAAIRLEQLWNEVAKTFEVDILCGYALSNFHNGEHQHVFQSIFAEHSAVYS